MVVFDARVLTMMKLFPQFDMVPKAQPLARSDDGKISAGIAHGIGPQVAPNVSMKNSKKATLVQAAAWCSVHLPLYLPTRMAMMK